MNQGIEIGSCLVRSWTLYKSEFGLIFFTTLVVTIAASAASGFPYIGPVIGLALNGVLYGGLYSFYLKLIRGQKAELPDAFAGFQTALVPLILGSLLTNVLFAALIIIASLPMLIPLVPLLIKYSKDPALAPDILLPALGAGAIVNIVLAAALAMLLYLLWIFTFPLIIDKRMEVWQAMETSRKTVMNNFGAMLGLFFVGILLTLLGVLACCIGMFFTLPVFFGAIAYAYEDLFAGSDRSPSI